MFKIVTMIIIIDITFGDKYYLIILFKEKK